jgi:hypothetical protein
MEVAMRRLSFFAVALLMAGNAVANDTMAEIAAGGISYVHSPDVEMSEERLYISMDKVKVDYVFTNKSSKDIETLIAFPLPDIQPNPDGDIAIRDAESDNFLGFMAWQDDKPIDVKLQQRAFALSIDVTQDLVSAGIPLANYNDKTRSALEKLDTAELKRMVERGILAIEEWDSGEGMKKHAVPLWTLKSTYYWTTVYPANASVKVAHEYLTGTGGTVGLTFLDENGKAGGEQLASYRKKYCVDDDFVGSVEKKVASRNPDDGPAYVENWISYILTTGANWSGPIGKFTLIVDKGAPANLVSFCGEGVKKTGPTTFEMTKTDFSPEEDLHVLVLRAQTQ